MCDLQEAKYVKAQNACIETEKYIEELDEMRDGVHQGMIKNAEQSFSLIEHKAKESFNKMILNEKSKEKVRLARREKARDFEKTKLIKLSQDHKAIEKLKDAAKQLHKKECLDLENKQIDDLVNSRFGIKQ